MCHSTMNSTAHAILVGVVFSSVSLTTFADIFSWQPVSGTYDGFFSDSTHWDLPGIPHLADTALFNDPNLYTVSFNDSEVTQLCDIASGEVTFEIGANSYICAGPGQTLDVSGTPTDARLNLNSGTLDVGFTNVGRNIVDVGTFVVSNPGTVLSVTNTFNVGTSGTGSMYLTLGATADVPNIYIGRNVQAIGTVAISDPNTTLDSLGPIFVGVRGEGNYIMDLSASASCTSMLVGDEVGSDGGIIIYGSGTQLTMAENLTIGRLGQASALITENATVLCKGEVGVGIENGSNGTIRVTSNAQLDCGIAMEMSTGGGTSLLGVYDGGIVTAVFTIALHNQAELRGDNGIINAGIANLDQGTVGPGEGAFYVGLLTAEQYLQGSQATFKADIAGFQPGTEYGRLEVDDADLDGTLVVSSVFFNPPLGSTFDIIHTVNGITGEFATEVLSELNDNLEFVVCYFDNNVRIKTMRKCRGDLNNDGVVSASDLLALIGMWGVCDPFPELCIANLDCDNTVNINDLLILISGWGPCP